jgi:arylsulfatase
VQVLDEQNDVGSPDAEVVQPAGHAQGDATLTLYVDTEQAGQAEITTQPGMFSLTGDGLCVGRDSGSAVSPDYTAPFPFTGGTIERVVIDVSGDHYIDHEKEVLAYLTRD